MPKIWWQKYIINVFEINQPIVVGVRCEIKFLTFTIYIGGYIF